MNQKLYNGINVTILLLLIFNNKIHTDDNVIKIIIWVIS